MSAAYKTEVWDDYARAFLAVMPSPMLKLNKAIAAYGKGNVCDFGCGAAKIAPFILHNEAVKSYTGIDSSLEMVNQARWHLEQFPVKPSEIIHGKIEFIDTGAYELEVVSGVLETVNQGYDFGLSINSYYTWDNPLAVLQSIYNALASDAEFILVTPNPRLDMANLLDKAERELVANPYFASFKAQNMALSGNEKALFVDMDVLVAQVREVGFKVIEANIAFYEGGLNFLRLIK